MREMQFQGDGEAVVDFCCKDEVDLWLERLELPNGNVRANVGQEYGFRVWDGPERFEPRVL